MSSARAEARKHNWHAERIGPPNAPSNTHLENVLRASQEAFKRDLTEGRLLMQHNLSDKRGGEEKAAERL